MTLSYNKRLAVLGQDRLPSLEACINRGIERETLRVLPDGTLARSPHPDHLGSKLCHPSITTDFSEVQPELITPVLQSVDATMDCLDEIHRFVYSGLREERLWPASMPCTLGADEEIPLAWYGESNLGRLKHTYRNGLSYRYGRSMQTICAVHYNFSIADEVWEVLWREEGGTGSITEFRSRRYFDLMRNFRRFSWLPIYLFGASPAVSSSFVRGKQHTLERFDGETYFSPHATSLRNGDLGYQSAAQSASFRICYNSLDNYVDTLLGAILSPFERYSQIGARRGAEYLQVNTHVLQSEAEFYTTVRAKCLPPPGVNFLARLRQQGVTYIEIRLLDVNPYLPNGIDAAQIRFLDTLLWYCLLADSPVHDDILCNVVQQNIHDTAIRGRDRSIKLDDQGARRSIAEWGLGLLEDMRPVAELLDRSLQIPAHTDSLARQRALLADPDLTPSARILEDMAMDGQTYVAFALHKTLAHRSHFLSRPLPEDRLELFRRQAEQSLRDQENIERSDTLGFDEYLEARMRGYMELRTAN